MFKKLKINVSVIPENEFATLPHWLVWKTYTLIMLLWIFNKTKLIKYNRDCFDFKKQGDCV